MATNIFELVATLGMDNTGFLTGLNLAGNALSGFSSTVAAKFGMLSSFAISFGKDVIQTGMRLDSSMASVKAVLGPIEGTAERIEEMRKNAIEQASDRIFTAEEAADAYYYMGMAGWKSEQMIRGLPAVMDLAAASGEDLAMTSDIVTDSLTAFRLGADDAQHYVDILAQTARNSNTNVAMMGDTFKYVAPMAGSLGASVEDVALSIGLMASQGVKASMAGTALSMIFSRIATNIGETQGKGARDTLEKMGVAFWDAGHKMRDWGDIILETRDKWKLLDDETKVIYAKRIAGQHHISAWMAMMNAEGSDVNKLAEAFNNAEGAAKQMAEDRLDSLGGDVEKFNSKLNELKHYIYDDIKSPLREVVQWATEGIEDISQAVNENGLAGGIDMLSKKIEEAGQKFAPMLESIGEAAAPVLKTLFTTTLSGMDDTIANLGRNFGSGLLSGLSDEFGKNTLPGGLLGLASNLLGGKIGSAGGLTSAMLGAFKADVEPSVDSEKLQAAMDAATANGAVTVEVGGFTFSTDYTAAEILDALRTSGWSGSVDEAVGSILEEAGLSGGPRSAEKFSETFQTTLDGKKFTVDVYGNLIMNAPVHHNASAMASGRIYTRPTVFGYADNAFQVAGDAGAEAVVGVSSLSGMIQNAVNRAVSGKTGGSRDITIVIELDGMQFARAVYRANNDEAQRVGARLAGVNA